LSEELLGVIKAERGYPKVHEDLFFTPSKVIVARIGGGLAYLLMIVAPLPVLADMGNRIVNKDKELRKLNIESILKADKNNYVISDADITKIELKKKMRIITLQIETQTKKIKFYPVGIPENIAGKEVVKHGLEEYESLLRPIFGDKLSM
jgi:hypothetical protein